MKSYHVIPFHAGERRQWRRALADQRLAEQAAARGLRVSRDKWNNFYLHLPREEIDARIEAGMSPMDPCAVLFMVSRSAVVGYLKTHTGPDLLLNAGQVYGRAIEGPLGNQEVRS